MDKNTFKKAVLAKGEVSVYDFGDVKLHAYKTNDLIDDEVFIVEKAGNAVVIESPCFFDNIKSVAFCCISTGVFGFPQDRAAEIAVQTVREFSENHDIEVIFNVFKDADYEIYRQLLR